MRSTVPYVFAAAGMIFFATAAGVEAQSIESGNGVVCDLPQQVEQFITLDIDTKDAIERINSQSTSGRCEFVDAAYLVGAVVGEASNPKGTWQIRKVLIVGLIIGRVTAPVQPYQKFTAFIISKASPI
jgi:hypothetical protein